MMETLERILGEHPFFQNLDEPYLQLVTGCASNVRFEPDAYIFREGEEANQFYLIRQGRVALQILAPDRGPITVETLEEGDILGWSWLIPPYNWHFDARALELTRAIALDAKCLRRKCEEDHNLGYELLKRFGHIMEQRLSSTRLQLLDMYGVRS
jgi:CRP/FNR family cyclic AMP-dependent transcriptional regulator